MVTVECPRCCSKISPTSKSCPVCGNLNVPAGTQRHRYLSRFKSDYDAFISQARKDLEAKTGKKPDDVIWTLAQQGKEGFMTFESFLFKQLEQEALSSSRVCPVCCHVNRPGSQKCEECGAPLHLENNVRKEKQ